MLRMPNTAHGRGVRIFPPNLWGAGSDVGSLSSGTWTPGRNGDGIITQASVDALPANEWVRVAGTQFQALTDLIAANGFAFPGDVYSSEKTVLGTFRAWVGCCNDGRYIFYPRGGGHNDSSMNGIWSMDVLKMGWGVVDHPSKPNAPEAPWTIEYKTSGSFTICRLAGGSGTDTDGLTLDRLPDGKPTSAHTYGGVWYDKKNKRLCTGRLSKWSYDLAPGVWSRERWIRGGVPAQFDPGQEFYYYAPKHKLFGYPSYFESDWYSFGSCPGDGLTWTNLPKPSNWRGKGAGTFLVPIDEHRLLWFWVAETDGLEKWAIFDMASETWNVGTGAAPSVGGLDRKNTGEMQVGMFIPTWGTQGQIIRTGGGSPVWNLWWLFDIASGENIEYPAVGARPTTITLAGNKYLTLPHLGIALALNDRVANLSTPAVHIMRYQ